ncbi:CheR family methyltransferase [Gulbenkiania mobilis]|uniref:Chemotaxis protein methyltransferase n=1 Tax=Gulbenkiania mobilis TaxID=397457 RepID=A0ABY2CY19_GULMO|nr:chemotaxis protein methyltransferase CheR [Gulbenkiania mobilis]
MGVLLKVAPTLRVVEGSQRELEFTTADFERVRTLMHRHAGIALGEAKRQMVYARLARRLRALGLRRFSDYLALLDAEPDGPEWQAFVNALTTNLTAFFRERHHFELLAQHARARRGRDAPYRVWSAAASTGEEAYSAAMTLAEVYGAASARFEVAGSDIDTQVLQEAARAIYPTDRLENVALPLKKAYCLRGRGRQAGCVRIQPFLAERVRFFRFNLCSERWPKLGPFDAIFCRNVMIYFDADTQRSVLLRLAECLAPDGLLFLGHSENIQHLGTPFVAAGQTAYRLPD